MILSSGYVVFIGLALSTGLWVYFILRKDRIEREPLITVLRVGAVGGIASAFCAGLLNLVFVMVTGIRFQPPLEWSNALSMSIFIGLNEEWWKMIATVWLVSKLHEFNEPVDGVIYGMAVSLGFAAVENIGYIEKYGLGVMIPRTVMSIPEHLGCGAVWGAGLAVARFGALKRKLPVVLLPYFLAAAAVHVLYDFVLFSSFPMKAGVAVFMVIALWVFVSKRIENLLAQSPFLTIGRCTKGGIWEE